MGDRINFSISDDSLSDEEKSKCIKTVYHILNIHEKATPKKKKKNAHLFQNIPL